MSLDLLLLDSKFGSVTSLKSFTKKKVISLINCLTDLLNDWLTESEQELMWSCKKSQDQRSPCIQRKHCHPSSPLLEKLPLDSASPTLLPSLFQPWHKLSHHINTLTWHQILAPFKEASFSLKYEKVAPLNGNKCINVSLNWRINKTNDINENVAKVIC